MTTAQLLDCLANEQIIVTRWGKTKLVGGKHKASKKPPFKIMGSVQPVKGREREFLPEGYRQSYVLKLYTKEQLLLSDDQKQQRADLLKIDGEMFEVIVVEKNRGLGMDHYKVYAARTNA